MANVKILVMRDGETWETHYHMDSAKIVETITQVTGATGPGCGVTLPQALPGRLFMVIKMSKLQFLYGDA